MDCVACKAENSLYGRVVITKMVPIADRNGTVKIGGQKLAQTDLKLFWDTDVASGEDRKIRGPIMCLHCEAEHYYVVGSKRPVRLGSYEDAVARGHTVLMAEG